MSLLSSILGFSAFGFGARCFQLGIQKRPIFDGPAAHVAIATVFGGIGYGAYFLEQRQSELIAEKKKQLEANRERENAAYAAAA